MNFKAPNSTATQLRFISCVTTNNMELVGSNLQIEYKYTPHQPEQGEFVQRDAQNKHGSSRSADHIPIELDRIYVIRIDLTEAFRRDLGLLLHGSIL